MKGRYKTYYPDILKPVSGDNPNKFLNKTKHYLSPEFVAHLRNRKSASPPDATVSDIYSLGLISLEVCTQAAEESFLNKDYTVNKELIQAKINEIHKSYSIGFLEIVIRMLTIDPTKRIPLDELIEASTQLLNKTGLPPLNLQRINEQTAMRVPPADSIEAGRSLEGASSKDTSQHLDSQQASSAADGRLQRSSQGSKNGSTALMSIEERKVSNAPSEDPQDSGISKAAFTRQPSSTSNFKRSPSGTNLVNTDIMMRVVQESEEIQRVKRDSRDVSPTFAGLPPRKPEPDALTDRSQDFFRQRNPSRTRGGRERSHSPLLKSYGSRGRMQEIQTPIQNPQPQTRQDSYAALQNKTHAEQTNPSVAVNLNLMFSQAEGSMPQYLASQAGSDRQPVPVAAPIQTQPIVFKKDPEPIRYISPTPTRLHQDPHMTSYNFSQQNTSEVQTLVVNQSSLQQQTSSFKPIIIQSNPRPPSIGVAITSHHNFQPTYINPFQPAVYSSSQQLFPSAASQQYQPIQLQPSQITQPANISSYSQLPVLNGYQPFDAFNPNNEISRAERNLAAQREASPSPISGRIVKVTRYSVDKNGERKLLEEEVANFSQTASNLQSYSRASESSLTGLSDPFKSDRHLEARSNRSSSREIVTSTVMKPFEHPHQHANQTKPPLPTANKSSRDLPPLPRSPVPGPQAQKQPVPEQPKPVSLQNIESPRLIEKVYQRDEQGNTVELKTYLEKDGTRRTEKRIAIDSKGQLYGKFKETGVNLNDVIIADPNLLQKVIEEQVQLLADKKEKLKEAIEARDKAEFKKRELDRIREPNIQPISETPMMKQPQADSEEKVKKIDLKKLEESSLKSAAKPDQNRDRSPDVSLPGWQRIDSNYKLDFDPNSKLEESARPSVADLQQEKENIPVESIKPNSLYYTESPMKPSTQKNQSPAKQPAPVVASPVKPMQPMPSHPQSKSQSKSQAEIIAGIKGKKIKVRYKEHNGKTYPIGISGNELKPEEKEWLLRKVLEKEGLTLEEIEAMEGRKLFDSSNLPDLTHPGDDPEDPDDDYQLALKQNIKASNLVKDIQNQIIKEQDEELVSQSSAYPSQRRIHGLEEQQASHGIVKFDLMSRPHESNNTRNEEMWFRTREQQVLEDTDGFKNIEMSKSSKKRAPQMTHSEQNGVFRVQVDKSDPDLNYESNDEALAGIAPRFNYDTETGYNPGFRQSFGSDKNAARGFGQDNNPSNFDPSDIDALLKHNENLLSKIKMDMKNIGESFVSASEVSGVRASRNQQSGLHQPINGGFGPSRQSDFDSKDFVDRSPIGLNEFESFKTKNNEVAAA